MRPIFNCFLHTSKRSECFPHGCRPETPVVFFTAQQFDTKMNPTFGALSNLTLSNIKSFGAAEKLIRGSIVSHLSTACPNVLSKCYYLSPSIDGPCCFQPLEKSYRALRFAARGDVVGSKLPEME